MIRPLFIRDTAGSPKVEDRTSRRFRGRAMKSAFMAAAEPLRTVIPIRAGWAVKASGVNEMRSLCEC